MKALRLACRIGGWIGDDRACLGMAGLLVLYVAPRVILALWSGRL